MKSTSRCLDVDERRRHELGRIHQEIRSGARRRAAHIRCSMASSRTHATSILGAEEVRRAGAAHQLGAPINQRREVFVGRAHRFRGSNRAIRYSTCRPSFGRISRHSAYQGTIVGIVLHHRRHDVIARSKVGQKRVHDDVVRFGGVPVMTMFARLGALMNRAMVSYAPRTAPWSIAMRSTGRDGRFRSREQGSETGRPAPAAVGCWRRYS